MMEQIRQNHEHNMVKNPNQQEADQMVIYKLSVLIQDPGGVLPSIGSIGV